MGDEHHEMDLPPIPEERTITPAPEDFENPPSLLRYLWPIGWIVLCALLWMSFSDAGWTAWNGGAHGDEPVEGR